MTRLRDTVFPKHCDYCERVFWTWEGLAHIRRVHGCGRRDGQAK